MTIYLTSALTTHKYFKRLTHVMKNRYITIIAIFISLTISLVASTVPELDRYKGIYEKELKRLTTTSQTQRLHVPQDHIQSMRALELEYQVEKIEQYE